MPNFGNGFGREFRIELFQEFARVTNDANRSMQKISEHLNENTAHNASNISYQDRTVKEEIDKLNETIKTISGSAGESNTEIVEARVDNDGISHTRIQDRISLVESNAFNELFYAPNKTQYVAHRGLSGISPENTLPAFELAGEAGYKCFECDVYRTADGFFVVHHDHLVDRMTDGAGNITLKTLAELKQLNIDAGNKVSLYPGTKIPTLEEFLDACIKYNVFAFIELKWFDDLNHIGDLLKILRTKGMFHRCALIGFDKNYLMKARELHPTIYLGFLEDTVSDESIAFARSLKNAFIQGEKKKITQERVDVAHANGLKIGAWTVDNRQEAEKLIGYGIDFIATNILMDRS
ncbi:glycerophosphodiester phosphodiesterase family protein [Bacillus sp. AR18-7]|uniref:glycerophosphodiester phosphodiesterase family protein n=1 Tax=Bacillus sp. AR18-7 TaxID=2217821 RepID=UPI0011C8B7EF|nr:glycerophosphodiester phosphodiesterase family protein [Bacillus sp. AR18-7]TXR65630.1 hypothetical protein DN395_09765 [Bacillus sp. AR18-7]